MTPHPDPHSLVAAYATDALDRDERSAFEKHLAHCQSCADELRGFRETTARLATSTPAEPPPQLRQSILAEAGRTRQLPPLATARPASSSVSLPTRHLRSRLYRATARPRVAVAAAAVVLVAVLVGALTLAGSAQHRLHSAQQTDALVRAVLAAPDATMLSKPVTTGGNIHVVMSPSKHALVFTAADLAALQPSERYELWLIRRGTDEPGGTLPQAKEGMVGPVPMLGVQPGDSLGLSVETRPRPSSPTTPMVAEVTL